MKSIKKYAAEFLGTFFLVFLGCTSACIFSTVLPSKIMFSSYSYTMPESTLSNEMLSLSFTSYVSLIVLTALTFGLAFAALYFCLSRVSGCHLNPAVSLAMLINKRLSFEHFMFYIVCQMAGGVCGSALTFFLFGKGIELGANGFDLGSFFQTPILRAFVLEVVLTFFFVMVFLFVTARRRPFALSGIVLGLSLTAVYLVGIPFTGGSVNPARSFGPALVDSFVNDGIALSQVWVFLLAPTVGAVLAALIFRLFCRPEPAAEAFEPAPVLPETPEGSVESGDAPLFEAPDASSEDAESPLPPKEDYFSGILSQVKNTASPEDENK